MLFKLPGFKLRLESCCNNKFGFAMLVPKGLIVFLISCDVLLLLLLLEFKLLLLFRKLISSRRLFGF